MSKTILYIEDNPNDQRFVEKVLGRKGYTLLVAGDGETGVKLAEEHGPDLILVDLHMPGLDGLETARRIRALECCAKSVMIALTAFAEKYKRAVYLEAGFTDYQQKQAGIKPLLDLVTRHLGD